jgi:hypothetical protein
MRTVYSYYTYNVPIIVNGTRDNQTAVHPREIH